MPTRLIAAILAAAMAMTSLSAAPAFAGDNRHLDRFIFSAGAILMLGAALSQSKRTVTRRHTDPVYETPRRRVVPSVCLRVNQSNHGPRKFFLRDCLRDTMRNYSALPGKCQRRVWSRSGNTTVFAARCLRQNGWVFG